MSEHLTPGVTNRRHSAGDCAWEHDRGREHFLWGPRQPPRPGGGGDAGNGSVRCVETWEDRKAFPAAVSHRGPVRTELSWIFYGRFLQRSYSHGDDSAHASGKRGLRVPCPTLCVGLALQETHRIWLEKGRVFKPGRRTRARTHSIVFASVPENAPGALTTAFHHFWWSLNTDFMKIPCFNASW